MSFAVAQALNSVNRVDVDSLIDLYLSTKQFWSASRLCHSMWSCGAAPDADRRDYMVKSLRSLSHVDKQSHPGALGIEVDVVLRFPTISHVSEAEFSQVATSYKLVLNYPSHIEVTGSADALIVAAERDGTNLNEADSKAVLKARQGAGQMHLGMYKTPYR